MIECKVCTEVKDSEEYYQLDETIYPVCFSCIQKNNKLIQDD